ncbi:hypothetical protein EJ07DRAFT_158422 [Lizonia empirigonia]|nr:hypothetical protein EJ07DRAFT_158422 [Lizonia empirigonia]
MLPSRKRPSAEQAGRAEPKRARVDYNAAAIAVQYKDSFSDDAPTADTRTKRSSAHFETKTAGSPGLKADSRAIYDENKADIDTWYDIQYSAKLGLPKHGKLKHSNAPWYEKLASWQAARGDTAPPAKKHKPNNSSAQPSPPQPDSAPLHKRCHARLPGDTVELPEHPFEQLSDFETMPNGNYACAHVYRNPPAECCVRGLDKEAKLEAIKKSGDAWRKRVERLIDQGMLDKGHKKWKNWVSEKLREKYQPLLWKKQQESKAERKRRKEEEEQRRRGGGGGTMGRAVVGVVEREDAQKGEVVHPQRLPSARAAPTVAPSSPIHENPPQPCPPIQCQSSNDIATTQSSFLANLARTNPRHLHRYDLLYHDAQYRKNLKAHPDFDRLRDWYMVYFLQEKGQPLSVAQKKLLADGDPSYSGRTRVGAPALAGVCSLFGEYVAGVRRGQTQSENVGGGVRGEVETSPALKQVLSVATLGTRVVAPDGALEARSALPAVLTAQAMDRHAEVCDRKTKDSELDGSTATRPVCLSIPRQPVAAIAAGGTTAFRSEASYLSELPHAFATGHKLVDAEMASAVDDIGLGAPLSEEQLAVLDCEDPLNRSCAVRTSHRIR